MGRNGHGPKWSWAKMITDGNDHGPKRSWAEIVMGRNYLEPTESSGWGVPVALMVLDRDDKNYTNIMSIVSVSERNIVCTCLDLKRKFLRFYRAFSDTFKSFRNLICLQKY